MSTDETRGDLIAVGALYFVVNLLFWLALQYLHISTLQRDLFTAKTIAVELDADNDNLRYIISMLNEHIDETDRQALDQEHVLRLFKDLR